MTFISRTAVERELAAGTLAEARVEGSSRRVRSRSSGRRAASRPAWPTRSSSSHGNGCDRPLGPRRAPRAARRARARAAVSRCQPALGGAGRGRRTSGARCRPTGSRRRRPSGGGADGLARASAAEARSTWRRRSRSRPACRSSRCLRPTPGPSGRRASGSVITTAGCEAAASGATLAGIVYEPELTLGLPRAETVGTSMNALAHAAEALYVKGRNDEGDREALAGARLIGEWLPRVVESPDDLEARRKLLEGAHARGRGARRGGSRPRARDGAGARRPLRAPARRDERAHPPARAPLQRARRRTRDRPLRRGDRHGRPGRSRAGARAARRLSNASATRACPKTSSTRSRRPPQSERARKRIRARQLLPKSQSCCARSTSSTALPTSSFSYGSTLSGESSPRSAWRPSCRREAARLPGASGCSHQPLKEP